jgi:hypothetical protein
LSKDFARHGCPTVFGIASFGSLSFEPHHFRFKLSSGEVIALQKLTLSANKRLMHRSKLQSYSIKFIGGGEQFGLTAD